MMEIDWAEVIQSVLYILISIVIPILIKYIKDKNKVEKMDKVLEYAEIAVKFAEQYYDEYDGDVKYTYASRWLSEQANKIGIKLNDDEIRGIVEAALKQVKLEFQDTWKDNNKISK